MQKNTLEYEYDEYDDGTKVTLNGWPLEYTSGVVGMHLTFISKMAVSKQYWYYEFMAFIAENGVFVGLFLGYSVLQFRDAVGHVCKKIQIGSYLFSGIGPDLK